MSHPFQPQQQQHHGPSWRRITWPLQTPAFIKPTMQMKIRTNGDPNVRGNIIRQIISTHQILLLNYGEQILGISRQILWCNRITQHHQTLRTLHLTFYNTPTRQNRWNNYMDSTSHGEWNHSTSSSHCSWNCFSQIKVSYGLSGAGPNMARISLASLISC